jgi:hypothetical protein
MPGLSTLHLETHLKIFTQGESFGKYLGYFATLNRAVSGHDPSPQKPEGFLIYRFSINFS